MPRRSAALPALLRRFAVLPALLLLLAACTGGGDGERPPDAAVTEEVPGTIVVASGRDVTGTNGVRQQLIDAWNRREQRTGSQYRARLVELPGSADEQRSQLLGALQSRSAEYDVVNLDVTWVPEFAEAGLVRALPDDVVDEDVIASVAETARWDGKVYAVPFNSDVGLLYYRRDLMRRAGVEEPYVPEGFTWDRLRGHVETLNAKLPGAFAKGWTTQLAAYEGRTVNAVEAFASAVPGLELVDGKGRYAGDVEELTRGVAELRRRTEPAYTLPDAAGSDEAAATSDFVKGRTLFLRAWPSAYPTLYQAFGDELGVARLPGRAVLGGQNLAVSRTSQRSGKATELIRYLTGRESERCLLEAGFAATRDSAYDGLVRCPPAVTAAPSPSPTGEGADGAPRRDGGRPGFADEMLRDALSEAVHRPRTPLYGAFTQTFITELGPLLGDGPPGDEELARRLDEALRRALPG
ncbi:extracellular solute-binding protein [Streptomyces sp. OP7]|uniref:extracellular solute-binding protein n=1 Tax=Streptomyces sp. OP7 TaxID=3142462 RepID=UPI0032E88323